MSEKTQAANSQLPDEDALSAFAQGAFGNNRRRRRTEEKKPTEAPAESIGQPEPPAPAEAAAPAPAAEEPPASKQEKQDSKTIRSETSQPSVPAPAPPADRTTEPAPANPAPKPEPEPRASGGDTQMTGGQVAVRAVAAPEPAAHRPVPLAYRADVQIDQVQVPNLGPAGARATQCTIMVSQNIRDRFAHYQLSKKMAGDKEPSNALVVRRAFLHAKRNNLFGKLLTDVYQQNNAVDEEDYDEDGMLGEVVGRRAVRGRLKDSGQQSFRPSEQELANYDAFTRAYGFPSRSDFLGAVLDEFLPQLPSAGRRR